ncbi:hypothetical protein [Methanobrevibacter sp.]
MDDFTASMFLINAFYVHFFLFKSSAADATFNPDIATNKNIAVKPIIRQYISS